MNINFYLYNYPWLRRTIAAGLLLIALAIFHTWTDMWKVQEELTQYGVPAQAAVTSRSSHIVSYDDEDGYVYTYKTEYQYGPDGQYGLPRYLGESGNYDTYQKAEVGWIQVVYSRQNPNISLPSGEFTPTGSFLAWSVSHMGAYLVGLVFLIASLFVDMIDLRKLWISLRQGRRAGAMGNPPIFRQGQG